MNIPLTLFFWFRYLIWISGIILAVLYFFGFKKLWLYPYFGLSIWLLLEDVFHFFVSCSKTNVRATLKSMLFWKLPLRIEPKEYVLKQVQLTRDFNQILGVAAGAFMAFYFGLKYIGNKELFLSKIGFLFIILSFLLVDFLIK